MNVDEAPPPSPSRAEEHHEQVTKQEEDDVVLQIPQEHFSPQLPTLSYPSDDQPPSNTVSEIPTVEHTAPSGSPILAHPGSDEVMAIEPSATLISVPVVVQSLGESSRAHLDTRRSPQDLNDEDDVSALLNSATTISEPPLPITRNESTQSQYLLSEPPSSTLFAPPAFSFDDEMVVESLEEDKPDISEPPLADTLKFNKSYTLPPLKTLPPEFQRNSKSSRRQKRDRDKDKDGKSHPEWMPLGAHKWGATIRANPVATKVAKSSKVLSTRDWNVGPFFRQV